MIKNKKCKKYLFPYPNLSGGFTLIETFVAVTILLVVVLGPMSLLSNALKNSRYIGDEITATYLAQEGVELMINKRDSNLSAPLDAKIFNCPSGSEESIENLKLDENTDGYQCNGSVNTIFKRTITAKNVINESGVTDPNQWEITSTVTRSNFPGKIIVSKTIVFTSM